MKIYEISKGQFVTVVVFSALVWFVFTIFALDKYDATAFDFLPTLLIPAALIFYVIGWQKARPKKPKSETPVMDEESKKLDYFFAVPLWKFVLLSVGSLGLYELVWGARNWIEISKQFPDKKISPVWRGLFLVVFFYPLAKKIHNVSILKGYKGYAQYAYPSLLSVVYLILIALSRHPDWGWFFGIGTLLPFIPLITKIQFIHQKKQLGIETKFTGRDWIMLLIGPTIILASFLFGLYLNLQQVHPESTNNSSLEVTVDEPIKPILESSQKSPSAEEKFEEQVRRADIERKCQAAAYEEFQRDRLPGYGWQAHWNHSLGICLLEITGWDTEIAGLWNTWIWEVGGQKHYGTLTIKNTYVASGLQSKSENPAKNGEVSTCKLNNNIDCSTIEEYYVHRDKLMTE